ncbi:MAG: YggU family protein [Deltaproteobacteria bacterium]|nr:YggU family protein [Deltaproteobacteria bacterium]
MTGKFPFITLDKDGILLELYIQPGASRNEIAGLHGARLKVKLISQPIGGNANKSLIEFLAERLKIKKKDLCLIQGIKSRGKRVRITGAPIDILNIKFEEIIKNIKGAA